MGKAARRRFLECFTHRRMVEETTALYDDVSRGLGIPAARELGKTHEPASLEPPSPEPPSPESRWLMKRIFDVALSGVGLVLSAPVWAVAATLIKLEDGGPVFYRQNHHRWTDGLSHRLRAAGAGTRRARLLGRNDMRGPIARGLSCYRATFLRADGTVPYYADGNGPLDVNNFAQMVITLELLRPDGWSGHVDRVLAAAIRGSGIPRPLPSPISVTANISTGRSEPPLMDEIWMMHALALRLAPEGE